MGGIGGPAGIPAAVVRAWPPAPTCAAWAPTTPTTCSTAASTRSRPRWRRATLAEEVCESAANRRRVTAAARRPPPGTPETWPRSGARPRAGPCGSTARSRPTSPGPTWSSWTGPPTSPPGRCRGAPPPPSSGATRRPRPPGSPRATTGPWPPPCSPPGRPLVVVTRDARRHPAQAAALRALLTARPDAVLVDMGWPGAAPARRRPHHHLRGVPRLRRGRRRPAPGRIACG